MLNRLLNTMPSWVASSLGELPSPEFEYAFRGLIIAWVLLELFVGRLGFGLNSLKSDRGSVLAVGLATSVGTWLAFAASLLGWLPVGVVWAQWAGLVLMPVGLGLRLLSILWLGPMFTRIVQIVPGHRLVTSGPYRFVRHPSYSGLMLFFAGMGAALGSWISPAAMLTIPMLGIVYRIRIEEAQLRAAFGPEYAEYEKKTGGLVPVVWRKL